jgi:Zn-dependent alcohol dehydrogenase
VGIGKVGTATVSKAELAAALNLIPAVNANKQKTVAEVSPGIYRTYESDGFNA